MRRHQLPSYATAQKQRDAFKRRREIISAAAELAQELAWKSRGRALSAAEARLLSAVQEHALKTLRSPEGKSGG